MFPSLKKSSWLHRVIPPQMQDLTFPFLERHEVPVKSFLQPARAPLNGRTTIYCISHSSHFCILCGNLLRVHSVASSKSLTKKSNTINLRGKPRVTGLHVDFVLLFTTLHTTDSNWWNGCLALHQFCIWSPALRDVIPVKQKMMNLPFSLFQKAKKIPV